MPPVEPVAKAFVADWRQLQRWGLSEARLPRGTELLFREPTLWQRYRTVVLVTLGVIGSLLLTRLLSSLVYGVSTLDPLTFGVVPLVLGSIALVATLIPARRAAAVDPAQVLRK